MTKAGSILILIIFIIESIFIIPLFWTIPSFILYSKVNKGQATEEQKIALAILGIIFGALLGIIGGILMLVDLNNKTTVINRDSRIIE
ncbi:hypothetical protein [Spiroplasma sp. AdecLV25b]|uniref:hypothetical protein n=1 Tax=Spiroplasma sp. AdecLV25b TaxID=3027162 RepID=UPI0027DF5F38|nr:hypothetical protein [Spiroplasma sp. AdecLV25b]